MVLAQRRALEKSRQATLASDPPPLPPPATSIARDLANALSTDGGRSALRSIFDALDTNGDGRVSKSEWGKGIRKHQLALSKYFGISLKEIGRRFSEMDTDDSADLSFEEFSAGALSLAAALRISDGMSSEKGQAEFRGLFDALDKDGNGRVSKKEWASGIFRNKVLLAKHFGGASLGEIGAAFARLDADGSGDLSFDELQSGARSLAAAVRIADGLSTSHGHAELKELFQRLDTNGDGRVSKKEWGTSLAANRELLRKYFGDVHSDLEEIGRAFNRLDADGSGDLTWEEFTKGATDVGDVWWVPV